MAIARLLSMHKMSKPKMNISAPCMFLIADYASQIEIQSSFFVSLPAVK